MATKLKILTMGLAIAATVAFAGGDKKNKEGFKAFEECKQRVENGANEDCSALLPEKKDCDGKKDFGDKKGFKKDGKSFDKKDKSGK